MTYRGFISTIRAMNKLLSSDGIINDRTILQETISSGNMIVAQSLNKRRYWQSSNLFTIFNCMEMETVPLSECCEYSSPCTIAKSILPLPKIVEGNFGMAVQYVFSVDMNKRMKETTATSYANLLKLGLPKLGLYFWIMNDHLYVTNEYTKKVNMSCYPAEMVSNQLLFPGEDCDCKPPPSQESLCMNPLDHTFHFIFEKEDDLKRMVYDKLMRTYFATAIDKTSDNLDETSK